MSNVKKQALGQPEGLVTKLLAENSGAPELIDADIGRIKGYASIFNVPDNDGDIMVKGCFDASLAQHKAAGTMLSMLWMHDYWEKPIGAWQSATVDGKGLILEGELAIDTEEGAEIYRLMKRKAITGLSLGFVIRRFESLINPQGEIIGRKIFEVDLYECSPVNFPCAPQARITEVKTDPLVGPSDPALSAPPPAPTIAGKTLNPETQPRLLASYARLQALKARVCKP